MDRISIVLQDKKTISELASDPDVQMRIKDALVDAVARRAGNVTKVTKELSSVLAEQVKKEFLNGAYVHRSLNDEYRQLVREQVRIEAKQMVHESLQEVSVELNRIVSEWKDEVLLRLKSFDMNKEVRRAAEDYIKKKFSL